MNVNSLGGSASLPVPLPPPAPPASTTPSGAATTGGTRPAAAPHGRVAGARPVAPGAAPSGSPAVRGELRLPGQAAPTDATPSTAGPTPAGAGPAATGPSGSGADGSPDGTGTSATHRHRPVHKPLPPLRGLTVAEIRAMLGVTLPSGGTDAAAAPEGQAATGVAPSVVQAAVERYA